MKVIGSFIAASLTIALGLGLTARPASAQEIETSRTRPNPAALSSGVFALGAPYVASVIVAAESSHPGDHDLYYPVAGPWMDIGDRHCSFGERCSNEGLYKGLLVADGIVQGIGALEIVGALLFPETVTVTSAKDRPREPGATHFASIEIGPAGVGTGYGIAALGAF